MIHFTVKYFASLREQFGDEHNIELESPLSISELWYHLHHCKLPSNILVAQNMHYVDPHQQISDGDEIAFFPPVTGG